MLHLKIIGTYAAEGRLRLSSGRGSTVVNCDLHQWDDTLF